MREAYDTDFSRYRLDAAKAAKDLIYGDEIVAEIKAAKTIGEIERIMRAARLERSDEKRISRRQFDGTSGGKYFN